MSASPSTLHRITPLAAWAALASVLAGCADPGAPLVGSEARAAQAPPCCESPPPFDPDARPAGDPPPPVNQPPHDVMTVPAAEVDRAAYLAVAARAGNPLLDALAGVAVELEAQQP